MRGGFGPSPADMITTKATDLIERSLGNPEHPQSETITLPRWIIGEAWDLLSDNPMMPENRDRIRAALRRHLWPE